ncbi:hypothetical protein WDU94_004260 [Cyamophila willieti]
MAAANSIRRVPLKGAQSVVLLRPIKHPSHMIPTSSFHILSNPVYKQSSGNGCKICAIFDKCKNAITPKKTCRRENVKPTEIEVKIEEKPVHQEKSFFGSFLHGGKKTETKIEDCKEFTFIPECEPQKIRIVKVVEQKETPKRSRLFYDKCSEECEEKFLLEESSCKPCKKECKPTVPICAQPVAPKLAPVQPPCPPHCRPPAGFAERFLHFFLPVTGFLLGFYFRSSPPTPQPPRPSAPEKKKPTLIEFIKPSTPVRKPDTCSDGKIDIYSRYCKDCNVDTVKIYRD